MYICSMKTFNKHIAVSNNEISYIFEDHMPVKLEQGGVFICKNGSAKLIIDLKQFTIHGGDMVMCFPFSVVQLISHSDDLEGSVVGVDLNFFSTINIPNKASYFLYIKDNPCIALTINEQQKILSLYGHINQEIENPTPQPLIEEIIDCWLRIMAYEIASIYLKRKPNSPEHNSRKQMIFHQFIFSLFNNYKQHRTLDYYASEQSITARHLSLVIKQISGQTAGEWITNCTIMNIKSLLMNPDQTIANIADELGFPNASFFSQYFRKNTGISPREFRKSHINE